MPMLSPILLSLSRKSQYESMKCQVFLPRVTWMRMADEPENEALMVQVTGRGAFSLRQSLSAGCCPLGRRTTMVSSRFSFVPS